METETRPKDTAKEKFQAEFEGLPLDEKYSRLFKLEAVALSETLAYVMESPAKAFEQAGVAIADFAKKFEHEAKEAFNHATKNADCGAKATDEPKRKPNSQNKKPKVPPSESV